MKNKKEFLKELYFWVWLCLAIVYFVTFFPYMNPFTVGAENMIVGSFKNFVEDYEIQRMVIYDHTHSEEIVATSNKEEIKTILDHFLALKVKASNWNNNEKPALDYRIIFSARYHNSNYLKNYQLDFNEEYFLRRDKYIYYKVKNENELYKLLKKEY